MIPLKEQVILLIKRGGINVKKEIARREFLKLKLSGYSYAECQIILEKACGFVVTMLTLKRWWRRFNEGEWNLRDTSRRPQRIHYKYPVEEVKRVIELRRVLGYSAYQLKQKGISIALQESLLGVNPKGSHKSTHSSLLLLECS